MSVVHPYAGRRVALATKHAKQGALAPALAARPGLQVVVPAGLDTDQLGTFTGEIERPAPPRETALIKARLGGEATGLGLALASEGSFGPLPGTFMVPGGVEILAFVDRNRGTEVVEQAVSSETNFAHLVTARLDGAVDRFLRRVGFPDHAVIVRPNRPGPVDALRKGVRDRSAVRRHIQTAATASGDGLARLETDMRAHMNPTRMRAIADLAVRLADRLATRCPDCAAPGYGTIAVERGLPCAVCGTPTEWARAEVLGCASCDRREERPRSDGLDVADPAHCGYCNP